MRSLAELLLRTVDGVFAVDASQRIVFWDGGCERLFGVTSQQSVGRQCSSVVRGKDPAEQPFCGGGCCISSFSDGTSIPSSFPLRACGGRGEEIRLNVSLLLVPAVRRDQRLCIHLLRRGEALDSARAFQGEESWGRRSGGAQVSRDSVPVNACRLTTKELEILKLLAEGLAVRSISQLKSISQVTVRNHVQHIEKKLSVHSQAEAIAYAYRHQLV